MDRQNPTPPPPAAPRHTVPGHPGKSPHHPRRSSRGRPPRRKRRKQIGRILASRGLLASRRSKSTEKLLRKRPAQRHPLHQPGHQDRNSPNPKQLRATPSRNFHRRFRPRRPKRIVTAPIRALLPGSTIPRPRHRRHRPRPSHSPKSSNPTQRHNKSPKPRTQRPIGEDHIAAIPVGAGVHHPPALALGMTPSRHPRFSMPDTSLHTPANPAC